MNGFTSKLVVHAIYIFFVTQIRSQYTQIWYDSMISKGRWTSSDDSLVTFNYQSAGCITGNCLKTDGQYGVNAYVYTYTGVAAFSSLQLQFDVSTDGLELTKTCTVYYAYNSESNKQQIAVIDPPDENRNFYDDQIVNLPYASSVTTVWIWLETTTNGDTSSSSDRCYWDSVYFRGIVRIPTSGPSTASGHPSYAPTLYPTTAPSAGPTVPTRIPTTTPPTHPSEYPTDAPTDPSQHPSDTPTVHPSTTPTKDPSKNPTYAPSNAPTATSQSPSDAPTLRPTTTPTTHPSEYPTDAPTAPSQHPSDTPTAHPSITPTANPSKYPTDTPTIHPSIAPTNYPSKYPTDVPTNIPASESSVSPETLKLNKAKSDTKDLETTYRILSITVSSSFGIMGLAAWGDSKYIRTNDYLKIGKILGMAIQTLDMVSDCFFAVNVSIQNRIDSAYLGLLILTICFIAIPAFATIVQLQFHSDKHWISSSDQVRGWLNKNNKMLFFLSVLIGNSFTVVTLVNSYVFQLDICDMGLTAKQLDAFVHKRVWSVVLLENVPQFFLQIWFIVLSKSGDPITITSMMLSLLSIVVSVFSWRTQKKISLTDRYVAISMKITGPAITSKITNCKTMKRVLAKKLAVLIGVHVSVIEVIKPTQIKQGVALNIHFSFSSESGNKRKDYHQELIEANKTEALQELFKESWDLSAKPDIHDIEIIEQTVVQPNPTELQLAEYQKGNDE